ncbi:MAG: hypothetical protein KDI42_11205 [Gammaproteobacteria bacterium]|nr:hypothetical protein [Gammaproteobacteria bacterium]
MRIEVAQSRLVALRDEHGRLRIEVDELLQRFKQTYSKGRLPVYLARAADHSRTPLRWRLRSTGTRIELTSYDGQRVLTPLSPVVVADLLEFDRSRLRLNYELATTTYEEERLGDFLSASLRLAATRKTVARR